MSMSPGAAKLQRALKDLREAWHVLKDQWRDKVRDEFEERYITALQMQSLQVLTASEKLGATLARAKRDCS